MGTEIDIEEDVSEANSTIHPQKEKQRKEKSLASVGKLREGDTRYTFIVQESVLETLKALAYDNRKQIKSIMHEAFEAYINNLDPHFVKQAKKIYKERT